MRIGSLQEAENGIRIVDVVDASYHPSNLQDTNQSDHLSQVRFSLTPENKGKNACLDQKYIEGRRARLDRIDRNDQPIEQSVLGNILTGGGASGFLKVVVKGIWKGIVKLVQSVVTGVVKEYAKQRAKEYLNNDIDNNEWDKDHVEDWDHGEEIREKIERGEENRV